MINLGIDVEERSYSPEYQQALLNFYRKNGSQTTIATNPNELPKLEGYPIPESTKPIVIGTPIPDQEKETGRFETLILEQDKNANILPGAEINVGDWRDNILTAENGDPAFKNGYVWKLNVDVDLRGTGKTFQDALDEAFKRTGHNKSEFIPVRWSKTSDGKSIPVQYNGPSGATINVDIGHTSMPFLRCTTYWL